MTSFKVKLRRIEYYTENVLVEANTAVEAERLADEMLSSGEISFDGEVCHAEESVIEVIESQEVSA